MRNTAVIAASLFLPALAAFAQTGTDFHYKLTEDKTGLVITAYTGTTAEVRVPAAIAAAPAGKADAPAGKADAPAGKAAAPAGKADAPAGKAGAPIGAPALMPVREIGGRSPGSPGAFEDAYHLTSVVIPEGVISIGRGAFSGCSNLSSVTLPQSLRAIGRRAFNACSITEITLPAGLEILGTGAFSWTELTSVSLPPRLLEGPVPGLIWGDDGEATAIFEGCFSLTTVTLPDGIIAIPEEMFRFCQALASITLPDSIRSIEDQAFAQTGLTSITLPQEIAFIGRRAFEGSAALTTVTVPPSARGAAIHESAFSVCPRLTAESRAALRTLGYKGEW